MISLLLCFLVERGLAETPTFNPLPPKITIEIDDSEFTFTLDQLVVWPDPYVLRQPDRVDDLLWTLTLTAFDLYDAMGNNQDTRELERLLEEICAEYLRAQGYSVRRRE